MATEFVFVNQTASSFTIKHEYRPIPQFQQLNLAPISVSTHEVGLGKECTITTDTTNSVVDERYERVVVIKRTSLDILSQTIQTLPKLIPDPVVDALKLLIPPPLRIDSDKDIGVVDTLKALVPPPFRPGGAVAEGFKKIIPGLKPKNDIAEVKPAQTHSDEKGYFEALADEYINIVKDKEAVFSLVGFPADEKLIAYPVPYAPYTEITTESLFFLKLLHSTLLGSQEALAVLLAQSVTHPFLLEALQAAPQGIKNLPQILAKIKELIPHHDKDTPIPYRIRHGPEDGLCKQEIDARAARIAGIRKKLKLPDEAAQPPIISTAASGGGMRAMIATIGFYAALKDMGVLDVVTYTASLSGSTWATSKWMNAAKNPWVAYKDKPDIQDCWNIDVDPEDVAQLDISGVVGTGSSKVTPPDALKIGFEAIRTGSLLMGYSTLLKIKMDVDTGDYTNLLGAKASAGQYPIPVYTACYLDNADKLQFADFTPFEIGSTQLQTYFNPNDFKLYAADIPPLLSQLMAVWGSAFYCTFAVLLEQISPKGTIPDWLSKLLGNSSLLKGAQTANANFNQVDPTTGKLLPMANQRYVYYRDGGIVANIPIVPMLRPERTVNLVIVCDASSTVASQPYGELVKAVPSIAAEVPSPPVYPYKFNATADHPTIIYIPIIANADFNPDFDPTKSCSTFSFVYDQDVVTNLQGLAYYLTTQAKDLIQKEITSLSHTDWVLL